MPNATVLSGDRIKNIQSAINSAVEFLLNARNSYGWWEDFHLAAGISDEWVTGYVGTALAKVPTASAQQAAREAWEVLITRRTHSSGWGYNRITPADADSTGWVLQLARAAGAADSDRASAARQFLAKH